VLFDPVPKEAREELFDREGELNELEAYAKSSSPLILVLGVRRIGKTSLLKVFINESDYPAIYVDARKLSEYGYSKAGLYRVLAESFNKQRRLVERLVEYLKRIKGIRVLDIGVEFDWRSKELSLSSILEKLDEYAEEEGKFFLVVIDEAQELRYLRGHGRIDFRSIIAYAYDNLHYVKFILSGSEVGVLHEFLGFNNYTSPLYGRVRSIVTLERFSRDKSVEFLEEGFNEAGFKAPRDLLCEVVEKLDGIPGWLAFYGYMAVQRRDPSILGQVLEEAVKVAKTELINLTKPSELYKHVLKAIAMGYKNWSNVKYFVEAHVGRPVYDKVLYESLKKLIALSIIAKLNEEYNFIDPLYREASKRL